MRDVQNKPTTQKWIKLLQLEHKRVLAARIPESSGLHKSQEVGKYHPLSQDNL